MAADRPKMNARITLPEQIFSAVITVGEEERTVRLTLPEQLVSAAVQVGEGEGLEPADTEQVVSARVTLGENPLRARITPREG